MREVGILAAFGAGLLSFLSPCVLPLIPGYLSFISGSGLAEVREGRGRAKMLIKTLAFVLGFTLVFVTLGLLFAGGGAALGTGGIGLGASRGGMSPMRILTLVAGILIVILGLNLIFDFLKALAMERRLLPGTAPKGLLGAFLFGMAFAAGWTPCIGPILASILLVAAREANPAKSLLLLGAYSLGLALPFLLSGLFLDRLKPLFGFFKRNARRVRTVSGVLLVAIGLAMAMGRFAILSSYAARAGFAVQDLLATDPQRAHSYAAWLWFSLAAIAAVATMAARRRPPRPLALALIAALAVIGISELAGIISTPSFLVAWLLFQGT